MLSMGMSGGEGEARVSTANTPAAPTLLSQLNMSLETALASPPPGPRRHKEDAVGGAGITLGPDIPIQQ